MLNRSLAPAIELPHEVSIEAPLVISASNASKIHCLPILNAPVFKLELLFWTDLSIEPEKGVFSTIIGTLLKGTNKKTSTEIEESFAKNGIFREFSTYTDHSSLAFYGLEEKLQSCLELIEEILTEANFPEEEIRKYNKIRLENLKISKEKTSYWGNRLLKEAVFGAEHIMGRTMEEDDFAPLNSYPNFLSDFRKYFKNSIEVIFSHRKGLDPYLLTNFFQGDFINRQILDFSDFQFNPKDFHQKLPNSEQATIKLGCPLPSCQSEQFNLLKVSNELIGGYFGSRLNKIIREDLGLTYGIYSSIVPFQGGSYFSVTAEVNKDAANEALKESKSQIELLLNEGVREQEFNTLINYMKGSILNDINNPFQIADRYRNALNHHLPFTETKEFYSFLNSLDLESFNEFLSKEIQLHSFSTVIVS